MPNFLHAVCGSYTKERTTREFAGADWKEVRMDAAAEVQPDIVASLLSMEAIADDAFDAAYTSHSLERLYPHEVETALANLFRVISPEGYLVVLAADLQSACALVADDKLLEPAYHSSAGPVAAMDIIYGFRPALASGNLRHACKSGFTSRALMNALSQAGFTSVWAARNQQSFTIAAIASKQERNIKRMKELAALHFS